MLETKYIPFTSLLGLLLILLPACKSSKQPYPFIAKKVQKTTTQVDDAQTYKERKESIKKKQELKKKMHDELPSHIKNMSHEELVKGKEYCLELGYTDLAIKHLERLIVISENTNELKKYRLELADHYFETGEFEKAGKLYSQYLEYYPGSDQREYVEYKAILCRFYITLQSDRDQTKTKETLALAQNYLEKTDVYAAYVQDVQQIQHAGYLRLLESESEIVQFYLRRNKYKAAENRLAHIKNHYLKYVQEYEPEVLKLEILLAEAQGHTHVAEEKKTELATRFTGHDTVQVTMNTKTDHVSKF